MENKQMKCIKGESCLHCGSNYCRFVDELDQLKANNDLFRTCHDNEQAKIRKYEQTLIEIKEVLQFYNNTTIGTDKGNGVFEFEVPNDNISGGKLIYCYDTNPAKKALQKIRECEVENEN